MSHYSYRPWSTDGENVRMNAWLYNGNEHQFFCFVELIVPSDKYRSQVFFALRRLEKAKTDHKNTVPVVNYKHEQLKYTIDVQNDLRFDFISTSDILHPAFVVIYPTFPVNKFNVQTTHLHCLETENSRVLYRFFMTKEVLLTTFKEYFWDDPDYEQLIQVTRVVHSSFRFTCHRRWNLGRYVEASR